jgi:hypothetical protein
MHLKKYGVRILAGLIWLKTVEYRALVNTVMSLRISQNVGNIFSIWTTVNFSGKVLFHGIVS